MPDPRPTRPHLTIVGSGPTAVYLLHELASHGAPVNVTILESGPVAGVGYPYSRTYNTVELLSNIASVEIPPLGPTLADWMEQQTDFFLHSVGVTRPISNVAYYPRVAVGEYFRAAFEASVQHLRDTGSHVAVYTNMRATDVAPRADGWEISVGDGQRHDGTFQTDIVVVATGHQFDSRPKEQGVRLLPGQAIISSRGDLDPSEVGMLGASLSAIDAVVAIATEYGEFDGDVESMVYRKYDPSQPLHITMMSRNGLLPEADFYYELPYPENTVFTEQAVAEEVANGAEGLLDRLFNLFIRELQASAPRFMNRYVLDTLSADTFAEQHFAERRDVDVWEWANWNLAECYVNHQYQRIVPWRYIILRCHELFGEAAASFTAADLGRFHRGLRTVFVDNYASVPLLSIRRLISLHQAGVLDLVALGASYRLERRRTPDPYWVTTGDRTMNFSAIVDARGQTALPLSELPLPSLRALLTSDTNTVSIDENARPMTTDGVLPGLHFWALPYLLHQHPFIQGLTACADIARRICSCILEHEELPSAPSSRIG